MTNKVIKGTTLLLLLVMSVFMISCDKEESITSDTVENYIDEVVFDMQEEGNCGRFGCYEFVFPITIDFPDSSSLDVNDYEELRDAIQAWHEANPDGGKPSLGFPLEVIDEEGTIISVDDRAELRQLRVECRREFFANHRPFGHRFRGQFCFSLNYPLTFVLPDGETVQVDGPSELKLRIRAWKRNNESTDERPTLQYPVTVTMEDGTEVEVASKEELQALKDECSG